MKLKKNEKLKLFQTRLSQDYPEYFQSLSEGRSVRDKFIKKKLKKMGSSVLGKFIKKKKLFKSHHHYPECSERKQEDPEVLHIVEKMLEACGSETSLQITLHILRNMEQKDSLERDEQHNKSLRRAQQALKSHLKQRFECIFEGSAQQGPPTLLNEIYTELYITEGGSGGVSNEHEKFILDWAEGRANQDIDFIFSLPFRDLNLKKDKEFSLMQLLQLYFPQLKEIKSINSDEVKVVFIFDGLDECRLPLDFQSNEICCDVTESSSVDVLLTNLIQGNLLPCSPLDHLPTCSSQSDPS
ncbi:hypothetical protein GJAV_G00274130 [Gymnothorax javanicus]|nr:hypothetical protein GJAV_G00274130 [Gymnothorax javanicus]